LAWQILAQDGEAENAGADGVSIVWKGELSSAPASPQRNWAYYNTADKKSYIYNGSVWTVLVKDGKDREPVDHITVTAPVKTTYKEGESLALAGMTIYAVSTDGSAVVVISEYTLSWNGETIQNDDTAITAQAGVKTAMVTWQGHADTFTITVLPVITTTATWTQALDIISADSDGTGSSPKVYTLEIQGEVSAPVGNHITGNYKTVRLTGSGTLSRLSQGRIFYVSNSNQTLIIDGPTLNGMAGNNAPVVYISGGTVKFLNGIIRGNTYSGTGGGVFGAFSGLKTFTMSGGTISGNTASEGGGVCVTVGTFTKTGGIIYGDSPASTTTPQTSGANANTATSASNAGKNGHAMFYGISSRYYCNETLTDDAGGDISATDTLPTTSGETLGNWTKR
jgi:hypothetical protein